MRCLKLGRKDYGEALGLQQELRVQRIAGVVEDTLLTLEHPKVITRGRRPSEQDFRLAPEQLLERGFAIEEAGRGGRLTYHGPGQLIGYFIFSLTEHGLSIPTFVRKVEQSVLETLQLFNISAARQEGFPGVWVEHRKIASIGLSIERGVSMHGMALNVDPEMTDFQWIVSCGIPNLEMTSMRRELGKAPALEQVEAAFQEAVRSTFEI